MEEENLDDRIVLLRTTHDKAWEECKSGAQRLVIGKPGEEISGAIYIKPNSKVPRAILIELRKEEESDGCNQGQDA